MGTCCTKTLGQGPGQSAPRGCEIARHGRQGEDSTKGADSKLKKYTELGALVAILRTGAVRLVMADFIVRQYYNTTEPMPCCQDLPEEAFLHIEDLTDEEIAKLSIFVLSYCSITADHPDPERYHLKDVAQILELYLQCPPDGGRDDCEDLRSRGYALGGQGQPVAVFWDWCGLPQDMPKGRRTAEETAMFEQGLRTMNAWYAHELTIVLLLTTLPEGAARPSYDGSGWTTFERSVAGIVTPGPRLLDVDERARAWLDGLKDRPYSNDSDFIRLANRHSDITRGAPREPRAFNSLIQGKRVTNGADIDKVLRPKYEETFNEVIGEAGAISLGYCGLTTKAARETLCVAAANCTQLRKLSLAGNGQVDLSLKEVGVKCKSLAHLDLKGCAAISGNLSTLSKHMQQIEVLNLYFTRVKGEIASLTCLKRLKALNLGKTQCGGDVAVLAGLQQLTHLDLSETKVTGNIAGLVGLAVLESLDLSCTRVTGDVAGLAGPAALKDLNRRYMTKVTGDVPGLAALGSLEQPTLYHSKKVTGDVAGLAGLAALVRLDLQRTPVMGDVAGLAGLEALQWLDLRETKVNGDIAGLAALGALDRLMLDDTAVSGNVGSLKGLKGLRLVSFKGKTFFGAEKVAMEAARDEEEEASSAA